MTVTNEFPGCAGFLKLHPSQVVEDIRGSKPCEKFLPCLEGRDGPGKDRVAIK